jgi:hypothetical protein
MRGGSSETYRQYFKFSQRRVNIFKKVVCNFTKSALTLIGMYCNVCIVAVGVIVLTYEHHLKMVQ